MNSPSLTFKIYDDQGQLRGATVHAEDAAALAAILGAGTQVRYRLRVLWTEGVDGEASYDEAAALMFSRLDEASPSEPEDPRSYLSKQGDRWQVIHQSSPLCALTTLDGAREVARRSKVQTAVYWHGDAGRFKRF